MFRKALNSSVYRLSFNSSPINCRFSSQIIRTNEEIIKSEKQKPIENKSNENIIKTITEIERQELAKVLKSPVEMDSYWEIKKVDKPIAEPKKIIDNKGTISTDFMAFMAHKYDFSVQGFKRRLKHYITLRERYNQRYITKRHAILGPELANAHFVVYRGGSVRFKHAPNVWFTDCDKFPNIYDPRYRLIAVDASNIKLRSDGIDNFSLLNSLQELNLSKNKFLDDFVCDKIGRLFRNSTQLSVLDLSYNPLITHRGIETLHRLRSLKRLVITGTKAANYPFIELLIILFNDVNPNCEIII